MCLASLLIKNKLYSNLLCIIVIICLLWVFNTDKNQTFYQKLFVLFNIMLLKYKYL